MKPRPIPRTRDDKPTAGGVAPRNPADGLLDDMIRLTTRAAKELDGTDLDAVERLGRVARALAAQDLARRKHAVANAAKLTRAQQIDLCFEVFAEMTEAEQRDMLQRLTRVHNGG